MSTALIFATQNAHKVAEVNALLPESIGVQSLAAIGHTEELAETHDTILENAIEKAAYIYERYGVNCFSEDSGLEIDALQGAPGVHTAYYAGAERNPIANMHLVLQQLGDTTARTARFRTIIALYWQGSLHTFEGVCEGTIATALRGENGFGYDPIFIPEGYDKTFAQLDAATKGALSHRGKAVAQLVAFLATRTP